MPVALLVAGVDAGRRDLHLGRALARVAEVHVGVALELVELSADLGHHRMPGREPQPGVGGVQDVVAGQVLELH